MPYQPIYRATPTTIKYLGKIEAAREIVEEMALPIVLEHQFQQEASFRSTHYSTKIEGNRLTLKQTRELLTGKEVIGRDIDKREVLNYYNCLEWIQNVSKKKEILLEKQIKDMHSIIQKGIVTGKLRGRYREAQNAIYDSQTRKVIYFPPEAKDIPQLMKELVEWLNRDTEIHPVLRAGIAHYQLVTIHPFMDGNGRTARALATLILYLEKYDLKGFYSLEEYYAQDLKNYYEELHRCQGLNFYEKPNPDITTWMDYFMRGVALVFEEVKERTLAATKRAPTTRNQRDIELLQSVGPKEKKILDYFRKHEQLRTKNLCALFHIKDRTARDLIQKWIAMGLLKKCGTGKRDAYYVLTVAYRRFIGG